MTAQRLRELIGSEKIRFLIAGALTTGLSYVSYVLLLSGLGPKAAYVLSYAIGIVWSYWISSVWVFHRPLTWKGLASFPLVYLLQAVASILLFAILVDTLAVPDLIAPLLIIIVTLPLTYLLGRMVIDRTSPARSESSEKLPP